MSLFSNYWKIQFHSKEFKVCVVTVVSNRSFWEDLRLDLEILHQLHPPQTTTVTTSLLGAQGHMCGPGMFLVIPLITGLVISDLIDCRARSVTVVSRNKYWVRDTMQLHCLK